MKVLAIKARKLGDTVLWTSALEALSSLKPERLDIAYSKFYRELFLEDPRFHSQFLLSGSLRENFPFRKAWVETKYDFVLNFHASPTTSLLSSLAQAKEKVIHYHSREAKTASGSLSIPNLGVPMSAIERDLNVVRAIGWNGESPNTKIFLKNPPTPVKKRIVLGLGASRPSKQYSLEYYLRASKLLAPDFEVIFNHDSDRLLSENSFWHKELLKYGKISITKDLTSLMQLLASSELYIGSDSGVKHLAIALGIKTLTLFGPESIGEWHGYDEKMHQTLQIDMACRDEDPADKKFAWCGAYSCPHGSHACMNLILPEEVVAVVRKTL